MKVAVTGFVALLCLAVQVAAFEPDTFIVVPEQPAQGDIVRVTVRLPAGAHAGSVTFRGRTSPGFTTGGLLNAYIGIDLDTKPGLYEVGYRFGDISGSSEIQVRSKEFATERLTVASKYTDLDADTLARVNEESAQLKEIWRTTTPVRLWTKSFVKPANGPRGSPFGLRRFFNDKPRSPHSGLDLKAPNGSDVFASNTGKVVLARDLFFTGNTVVLDHGHGLYTIYAHLSRIDVEKGQTAERSQRIGLVGATGRVTGPHLHWAAKLGGARVDPETLPGVAL